MSGPALLVDVRNSLYKAIHASKADNSKAYTKHHYFAILLRQMASWMNKLRPSSVHIFWDAPRKEVWRKAALPTYKNRVHNPNSSYPDITEELLSTTAIATEFFKHMKQEGQSKRSCNNGKCKALIELLKHIDWLDCIDELYSTETHRARRYLLTEKHPKYKSFEKVIGKDKIEMWKQWREEGKQQRQKKLA